MEAPYDFETLKGIILKMNPEQSKPVNKGELLQKWGQAGASDKATRTKAFNQLVDEAKILADNTKVQLGDTPIMMLSYQDMIAEVQNRQNQQRWEMECQMIKKQNENAKKKQRLPEMPTLLPSKENAKDYFTWEGGQEVFVKRTVAREAGFMKHPAGFYFRFLKKGGDAGKTSPVAETPCACHYEGKLVTGQIFDSSYKRGEPTTFAPNQVIKSWTMILQLMREGDCCELIAPPALAYGAQGAGGAIPPMSWLIFRVEIVKVLKEGKSAEEAASALKMLVKKNYDDIPAVKVVEVEDQKKE